MPILSALSRTKKLAVIAKHLKPASEILEVGSGAGWFSLRLRRLGHHVTTIDLVPPADIVGDILNWRQLGLEEHSFDAIVGLEVIEHVDCTAAMRALCRPDGLIFLSSPHPSWDWVMQLLESVGLNQRRTSPHTNLVDFRSLPFDPVDLTRPAWIHQVGVFRNSARSAALLAQGVNGSHLFPT
jgi:SAM-dependent methyltransferase